MNAPNTAFVTQTLRYSEDAIAAAAALIKAGGIVAVPTETVYGLAADATDPLAVAAIYAAKGRPSYNPLIVHVLDLAAAEAIAVFDAGARALAQAFWPGPLTLVLPLRPEAKIAGLTSADLGTIALRVPAHRAMRALLAASGKPLAAPSANASGAISPTRAEHVLTSLGGRIPMIIDDGPTNAGIESTIMMAGQILRPGPVTADMIEAVIGKRADPTRADIACAIVAPGQLASHYAPTKPLRLNAITADADEWLIGFGEVSGDDTLSATGDLTEAAARLFDAIHRADASDRPAIAVAPVSGEGIGAAINDRLRRAAN